MAEGARSPFGKLLRAYRQQKGLSQAGLADLIAERNLNDPSFAKLGVVTEKAIANLETASRPPSRWVRPRPQTVSLFLAALEIPPGSREEQAFLAAAEEARNRTAPRTATVRQPNMFVPDGREQQVEQLFSTWETVRNGTPEFVLVAGDAGTGKSRLIHYLNETIQAEHSSARFVVSGCTPGASTIEPYQPFLQAFNHILGLSMAGTTGKEHRDAHEVKLVEALITEAPGLVGPLVSETALLDRLREMGDKGRNLSETLTRYRALNSPIEPSIRLDQTVRFLARVATIQPLVLVLEDLHWADERTCALLLYLQRHLQDRDNTPLMVIGSYRSNDLPPRDLVARAPLQPSIAELADMARSPLIDLSSSVGNENGRRFINGLLRDMGIDEVAADGIGEFLFERTQGHPLFAIELFRWLRDRRQLQPKSDGTWRPAPSAIMNSVPWKVLAMVAERIERLPSHLRKVLTIASAQGQQFPVEVLTSAANLDEAELATIIDDQLVAHHRLLIPCETTLSAGIVVHRYMFSHALFQEYLYSSLSAIERKRTHRLIAQALVDVLGIDNNAAAGQIAMHFVEAESFQEAGFYAYIAGSYATQQMEYEMANDWLERSIEYATRARDYARVGRAQNGLALLKRRAGQFDEGIRLANQVLEDAQRQGFMNLEAECYTQLGQFYYDLSELDRAEDFFIKAIEIYTKLGNRFDMSGAESMLSHVYYRKGRYDDALAHARIAGRLSSELKHDDQTAEAMLAAGNCEIDLGMYEKAIDTYRQAQQFYRSAGDHRGELLCALNSGLANVQLGEYDEAILILNGAMELVMRRQLDRYVPFVATYLGMAYEGRGDLDKAAEYFRAGRDGRLDAGLGGFAQDNIAGLLRIATARGDRAAMASYVRTLGDWLTNQGAAGLEDPLLAYLSLAIAQEVLGDIESSRNMIRAAYKLLMSRASLLTDPETVRIYLDDVPTNRQIRARYAAIMPSSRRQHVRKLEDAREQDIAAP